MAGQRELAREVRTGLTVIQGNKLQADRNMKKAINKLDKLSYGKPIRQHVKEFGALMAAILLGIAAVQIYKSRPPFTPSILISAAGVLAFLGYKAPAILHPVWAGWMKFASILGLIMTTLLLSIAWVVVIIPLSYIMRFAGVGMMNAKYKQEKASYWEDRDEKYHDFKLLEKQF